MAPIVLEPALAGLTATEVMITAPRTLAVDVTIDRALREFGDDHIHLLLLTSDGVLRGTLTRADLAGVGRSAAAAAHARLAGRTVGATEPVERLHQTMLTHRSRRLAVVDSDSRLLGLVCLKRSGTGFCTDEGVRSRAGEREVRRAPDGTSGPS